MTSYQSLLTAPLIFCLSLAAHAETLVSLSGFSGYVGGTLTVGWMQDAAKNVEISAGLESGNGTPSDYTMYLTRSIGTPGAESSEVAVSMGTLPPFPYGSSGELLLSLFQGLTLQKGEYWLTLYAPQPYVSWDVCSPCAITEDAQAQYIDWGYARGSTAPYPPSSLFTLGSKAFSYGLDFLVTGDLEEGPGQAPEPASSVEFAIAMTALAAISARRGVWRSSRYRISQQIEALAALSDRK